MTDPVAAPAGVRERRGRRELDTGTGPETRKQLNAGLAAMNDLRRH
ncbi:hypothetical protein [Amycolatopsis sp.]|nr:hypothetical protein [Amycolatopsis sp.]HVV12640.1 hypothetical protein [Amycolatopsis sp.]